MGPRNHHPDHDREEWQRTDEWLTPADLGKEPHPNPPLTRDGGEQPTTKEAAR